MIIQHGKVVAEWGNTTKRTELASIRKSLLSSLIGIAVAEHLIKLDSTLGELGIDDNPPSLSEVEKGATVRGLNCSTSTGSCKSMPSRSLSDVTGKPPERPLPSEGLSETWK